MSTGMLLTVAVLAVAVLLVLVIKLRMSAFVGLLLVSFGTALAAGIPVQEVMPTLIEGMGKTLGSVMIVVGLGAMLGRVIEYSGGAESLAQYFTNKLGVNRVVAAVTIAAFILGIPVFFDVAFIILAPLVFAFAKVAKLSPLKLGLPVAAVLLTVHVALPPHPGPVAAAEILKVDAGTMILLALPICALTGVIGFFAARLIRTEKIITTASPAAEFLDSQAAEDTATEGTAVEGKAAKGNAADSAAEDKLAEGTAAEDTAAKGTAAGRDAQTGKLRAKRVKAPSALTVCAIILLPILQIMVGTVGTMSTKSGSTAHNWFSMIGASAFALLVAVLVVYLVIGGQQRWSAEKRGSILDSALPAVAVIVFVTGAGGVFANVLVKSGIGAALSDTLLASSIPLLLMAYIIALALRASQGSATVAILTTAGLLTQPLLDAGYSPLQLTLATIAMCFGGLGLSHINDSGFWIVTKYLGLSVKDGLKTWTVLSTLFSLVGFIITWGVFLVVS